MPQRNAAVRARAVKPKTEELLYLLLWSAEGLLRPSFRSLDNSFESWVYRNGLLRRLHALEREQFLEKASRAPTTALYRLTNQGRLHALGGRDPQQRWTRKWDG